MKVDESWWEFKLSLFLAFHWLSCTLVDSRELWSSVNSQLPCRTLNAMSTSLTKCMKVEQDSHPILVIQLPYKSHARRLNEHIKSWIKLSSKFGHSTWSHTTRGQSRFNSDNSWKNTFPNLVIIKTHTTFLLDWLVFGPSLSRRANRLGTWLKILGYDTNMVGFILI